MMGTIHSKLKETLLNLSKKCASCRLEKPIDEFYFGKTRGVRKKEYFHSYCKPCIALKQKAYLSSSRGQETKKRYYSYLKESGKIKEHNRLAFLKKKKKMLEEPEYARRVRDKDSFYRKLPHYQEKRRSANLKRLEKPEMRLHNNTARLVRYSLKEAKGKCHTEDLLGYSMVVLKKHIENQFDDKMSWDNYGSYWHIDHIKPRNWPNISFEEVWALENLRPLEAKANIAKADSWEYAPNVFISCQK